MLGQIDFGAKAGVPRIGDNVFLGTNSIVVGKIKIGNDVLIAPGGLERMPIWNACENVYTRM